MNWKVLVTARGIENVGDPVRRILGEAGCEIVLPPEFGPLNAGELTPLLSNMDAVLASVDEYPRSLMESEEATGIKIISRWGVGLDGVDLQAATDQGIVVAYTPGILGETVADYTFALLLSLARRIPDGLRTIEAGEWTNHWGPDVNGKTMGIIGCGSIGQAVARRAAGFNMKLLGFDVQPSEAAKQLNIEFVSLEELLKAGDFISLNCALTQENRNLINASTLAQMKPSAYLINTARGGLIDEEALAEALKAGTIAGAALDTFKQEPFSKDHPFRTTPNLLLTPHQAFCGRECGENVGATAARAIVDLMQGRKPRHPANEAVFQNRLRAALEGSS